jgi:hypothetical protein
MLYAAICDACRQALLEHATSVQIMPGVIIATSNGPTMRSAGSPESYFLCDSCVSVVTQALGQLLGRHGYSAAEQQRAS